jgi:hypothetical protein
MVTESAHSAQASNPGLLARVGGQVHQFVCGLHGHDSLLHFQTGRLSLLCTSCGHETPWWDVKAEPVHRATEAPKRGAIRIPIRISLFGERRVA